MEHDFAEQLPALGRFDAVVSSFAIHHLEHVASPSERPHVAFFAVIGEPLEDEDPSDCLIGVEPQLAWLRELGLDDVGRYWKWLEMVLLVGVMPIGS